jgi:phage baseplate assembly protein W
MVSGFAFPFAFVNGRVKTSSGVQHLRDNLHALIMTAELELPMLPTFGCSIHRRIFDPINTMPLAMRDVVAAAKRWEKRIAIDKVDAAYSPEGDGLVDLTLQFSIVGTEQSSELVLRQGG